MPKALQRASAMLLEASGKALFCQTLLEDIAEDNSKTYAKEVSNRRASRLAETVDDRIKMLEKFRFNQKLLSENLKGAKTLFEYAVEETELALQKIDAELEALYKDKALHKDKFPQRPQ